VTSSGSATATITTAATLTVNATGLQTEGDRYVLAVNKGTAVSFTADVLCYGGTVDYSWSPSSPAFGSVTGTGTHNENAGISPSAGGKYTLTVTADLGGGRTPLTKDIDVYVFDLALSGGTSLSAPTPSNEHYGLFLTTSDTAGTEVTASLNGTGMPDVEYVWEPADGADDKVTISGTGASRTLTPKAAGTTSFTVGVSYGGTTVTSKTVDVAVAGLTLTGDSTIVFNSDPAAPATANHITLTATLAGIPATALTPVGITFESDDTSIATVTAGTASGTGRPATVTALKWGTVIITAKATIAATSTELTATKKITILELVVKQGTAVLPDSGNIIAEGATVPLTAELKGPPAGSDIEYTWEGDTSGMLSPASTSGTDTVLTTGTGVPAGYGANITVTATYNGTEYSKVMGWSIGFSGSTADFLKATFAPNTLAKACTVKITGATTMADLQAIAKALGDPTDSNYKGVYIKLDLSGATGLTSTGDGTFYATGSKAGLATYLTGIVLPTSGLTTIGHNAFRGCTNLSGSVTIPASCDCIGKCSFKDTGITALSDGASPARTWHRVLNTVGSPDYTTPWSGTLSGAGALTALNTEISDDVLYIPLP
ncbi:MAG: leucine-rich repeat protein, partial [Treponema sp.]|nr:leucine-rich repeat protein [Treponema sp.]